MGGGGPPHPTPPTCLSENCASGEEQSAEIVTTFVSPASRSARHGHAAELLPALALATRTTPAAASGAKVRTDGWTMNDAPSQGMRIAEFAVSVTPPLDEQRYVAPWGVPTL